MKSSCRNNFLDYVHSRSKKEGLYKDRAHDPRAPKEEKERMMDEISFSAPPDPPNIIPFVVPARHTPVAFHRLSERIPAGSLSQI